jgi:RloB-like protein
MGSRRRSIFARAKATRLPKTRFIIYCEGAKTEPGYFNAIKRKLGNQLIDIELLPTGVPKTIADQAVKRAKEEGLVKRLRRRRRDSFESNDQVWAVFDRDEHISFEESVSYCLENNVGVARSNPCFEVWLILHLEDFQKPDNRRQVCRHLRVIHPEYDPNGPKLCDWSKLIERVEIAERRAAEQLANRENEGAPFGRPSTTAGQLTRAIRRAAQSSEPGAL